MITVQEAIRLITDSLAALGTEELPLGQVQGKVLARDFTAPFALPRFTNAAMDGFALRLDDIRDASDDAPVRLKVTQRIAAGGMATLAVPSGCCAEIMTGAPLPEGADTVVAFEQSSGFGSEDVEIFKAPKRGANIRYGGEEISAGETLLRQGSILTPAEIAVLASFGCASVMVQRVPGVSIVTVGDEVCMPGEELSGAQIYNCNSFMLDAACRSVGIVPVTLRHVPDNRVLLRQAIAQALAESDVLVTVGGISSGEYDYVQDELSALGVIKTFWSVAQKPGKPLYYGHTIEGKAIFSLPGNPVSAIVCFVKYCLPALYALQAKTCHNTFRAILAEPFPADKKRHRFLLGQVRSEGGQLLCRLSPKVESHNITSVLDANCLAESAPSGDILPSGSEVLCTWLPWANMISS